MRPLPSVRRAAAAWLAAATALSALPAAAAEGWPAAGPSGWWSPAGHVLAHVTLPGGAPVAHTGRGTPAAPVVFVLPDDVWDTRRARPCPAHLSISGAAVVELWFDEDRRPGLAEARTAVASAVEEFNLDPSRVALLGFGTGGRLALSLAGPDRPAAALYPACQGAPVPAADARVVELHPDEASEAQACAALVADLPAGRSDRASAGAGHAWDAIGEPGAGRTLLPHPDDPDAKRRLRAHPDGRATMHAAQAVSDFLVGGAAAPRPTPAGGSALRDP